MSARVLLAAVLAAALVAAPAAAAPKRDYVDLVDPFVEADIARYFFFQSASQPFGFVKLRPDTSTHSSGGTGYRTTENDVKGFSHIHEWQLSGVQVMPTSGASVPKTEGDTGWQSHVDHDETEVAEPGYHRVELDRYGIDAELTATERVGVHRYTYRRAGPSEIIVNLAGVLGEAVMEDAHVTRVSDRRISGWVRQHGGAYAAHDAQLFFDIRFDKPFDSLRGWSRGRPADGGAPLEELAGDQMGVYARYDHLDAGDVVQMKVALSFTGTDGAARNMEAEAPGWDFDALRAASRKQWNAMLGRFDVQGGTHRQQVKFYTDLFHVLCGRSAISDVDGRYIDDTWNAGRVRQIPLDGRGRPRFAMFNYDALWLTQWNVNSVLGLAYPEVYSDFVNSQLQMYKDGGLLPRGPIAGNDSLIMTGSPVTSFISGAFNKGIRDFDADLAYEAMLDAQSVGGLFDKGALEYTGWSGSGGIRGYLDKGYVPYRPGGGLNGGAGMTLEYAFQDWTLAQLARRLGKKGINVAQYATASASSQADGGAHAAARAIDGRPARSGDVEWASDGESEPWLRLDWDEPHTVREIALSDRSDPGVNAAGGTLRFSDGSSVPVEGIPADGARKVVRFAPRTVDWVRFEAAGGAGGDVGLAELEVWDDRDAAAYLEGRSRNWRNVFDAESGFVRPRWPDGRFIEDFDPLSPSDFVESNAWQATWFTSHDVIGLANAMGGEAAYADKLQYAFRRAEPANFIGSYGNGYVSYGNQPGLQVAHLFNYVGYPWLTQHWVRQVKEKTFGSTSTTDGYGHHDEDQGQMGATSLLMAIGLFEVTGGGLEKPVYDVTSPVFERVSIQLDRDYYEGDKFQIVTHGDTRDEYIQRAELDGRPLRNAFFRHEQLADGGALHLWLGPEPNRKWGTEQLPPSESASEGREPVHATGIALEGPDEVRVPYGSTRYEARFTPSDTTLQRATWKVTAPDGSPTDLAQIDQDGLLTVGDRDGAVLITAANADSGPRVEAKRLVTLDLDPELLRGNASRWPGATASASSEFSAGYGADKVRDGVVGSKDGGDWASRSEREPWVQLDWDEPIRTDRILIYDRPGDDDANGGELVFSDGSRIAVDGLPPSGAAKVVEFPERAIDSVRFQIRGGTGLNPGLSELEVLAVPSAPDAPQDIRVARRDGEATVAWKPPAFDGGAPVTGYVVRTYRDGALVDELEAGEDRREATVPAAAGDAFAIAARNLLGVGEEGTEPVLAESIAIAGPERVEEPYGSVRYEAAFSPDDTTLKRAEWSVSEPDGSPTQKATIDDQGRLTVNHRDGDVLVTATAADGGGAKAAKLVAIALDPALMRSNAALWPGVTATGSSQYNEDYRPEKAIDGFGSFSGEWASAGEQEPWIELAWDRTVKADAIVLHDRPGPDDARGGTLTFSDGSTVEVAGIPADGSPLTVRFAAREFDRVRFEIGGAGPNVGLRELEVQALPETPPAPARVAATAGERSAAVTWDPPAFDGGAPVTGYVVTPYRGDVALAPVSVGADENRAEVTGLEAGTAYRFTVAARNVIGTGEPSVPAGPVTPR